MGITSGAAERITATRRANGYAVDFQNVLAPLTVSITA
jgi:hypothetical protein